MKFHFDAYALCEIDENDGEPIANLLGIFHSRRDIAPYVRAIALADLKADRVYRQQWEWLCDRTCHHYVAVPISHIEEFWWGDIEETIKAAALLQFKGYGKTVAA